MDKTIHVPPHVCIRVLSSWIDNWMVKNPSGWSCLEHSSSRSYSTWRPGRRWGPQEFILGLLLLNVFTEDLEKNREYVHVKFSGDSSFRAIANTLSGWPLKGAEGGWQDGPRAILRSPARIQAESRPWEEQPPAMTQAGEWMTMPTETPLEVTADSAFGPLEVPSNLSCVSMVNTCRNSLSLFSYCHFGHCSVPSLETQLFSGRFLQFQVFVLKYALFHYKWYTSGIPVSFTDANFWCSQLTQVHHRLVQTYCWYYTGCSHLHLYGHSLDWSQNVSADPTCFLFFL